jgi:hypothetical protein
MKTWIPRLILTAFALLLAFAVYWGYKLQKEPGLPGYSFSIRAWG